MTLHYYPEVDQGSDEWLELRRGIVTASTIGALLTTATVGPEEYGCPECGAVVGDPCVSLRGGKPIKTMHDGRYHVAREVGATTVDVADNDTSRGLLLSLAAERITGRIDPVYVTFDMQRGKDDEPYARDAYAAHTGQPVEEMGFIVHQDDETGVKVGYSPDGLVGKPGLIEIKSRRQKTQVSTVINDEVPSANVAQLQVGMWVTGRPWCDYVSYGNGMHLYVRRVLPDPAWQAAIPRAVEHAEAVIASYVATYQARTKDSYLCEYRPDFDDIY